MTHLTKYSSLLLVLTLAACGDSTTAPEPEPFPVIAGTYTGTLAGSAPLADGRTLTIDIDFIVSISQTEGQLSGGYQLSGAGEACEAPDYACAGLSIGGGGTFSGQVTRAGQITVDFRSPGCPARPNVWRGSAAPGSFTLNGVLEFLSETCEPLARFQANVLFVQ